MTGFDFQQFRGVTRTVNHGHRNDLADFSADTKKKSAVWTGLHWKIINSLVHKQSVEKEWELYHTINMLYTSDVKSQSLI